MNRFMGELYNFVAVSIFMTLLSGCAGLSQQYNATTKGIAINYIINKEQFVDPKLKIFIMSSDERLDKEVIGGGAKSTVGTRFMGYLAFGIFYAAIPDQPILRDQEDPIRIFKISMTERLSKNSIVVTNDTDTDLMIIELLVRQFKLDFNFGKWSADVGYVGRVRKNGEIVCESNIFEKSNVFNLYGFGSGEKALNEAFNKAINKLDINNCFQKSSSLLIGQGQKPAASANTPYQSVVEEIPLVKAGGVYGIPVELNGVLTLQFILDSGASEVNIPADVVLTLVRTGTIKDTDFLPGKTYVLADGSELRSPRFTIRRLKIGTRRITNVPASVGNLTSSLLLGQNLLERLGTWGIDSQRKVLIINSSASQTR